MALHKYTYNLPPSDDGIVEMQISCRYINIFFITYIYTILNYLIFSIFITSL